MFRKQSVSIPVVPGRISRLKSGKTTYVYYQTGERTYDKEKQYTTAAKSIIGKECPDDSTRMFPNDNYFVFFPNAPVSDIDEEPGRSYSVKIGNYILISNIIADLKLSKVLSHCFDDNDKNLLLDLATYSIVTEGNVGQYYPMYAFEHALFTCGMKMYSDSKISRWFHSVQTTDMISTIEEWNKLRNHRDPIYISYDSTNKNSQAGDIDFVEYGSPKVDVGLPIVNYSIAYDVKERLPLFYESYPGSIPDVSQFRYMVSKAEKYKYSNIGFILDRGYFSQTNLTELDDKKFPFIIMVKGRKKLVRSIIEEKLHTFEKKSKNYIREFNVFGCTVERKLFDNDKKNRYIHLYHSISKEAAELALLNEELDRMRKEMDKCIGESVELPKSYEAYFSLYYNDVESTTEENKTEVRKIFAAYEEKEDIVEQERNLCGYFSIATSNKMSASEALVIYKSRDISEKVFRGDKSYLGNKSLRVYSSESTETKIFVEFFALAIRSRLYAKLHDYNLSLPNKVNYMTVPAAIRELEKIIMIRLPDGRYHMSHAVTKTQKTIYAAFGLTEENVTEEAKKIADILKKAEDRNGKTEKEIA